jgi:cysteine-rich repeat protein
MGARGAMLFCCLLLFGAATAHAQAVVCGDHVRAGAEQCDDGNRYGGDGCAADCTFEQVQRVNSLAMQFNTASCAQNRFGSAFVGTVARDQLNNAFAAGVQDGSISLVVPFAGLASPTGADDAALSIGILNGTPVTPGATPYDGRNDIDWWYRLSLSDLDDAGLPLESLPAAISGGVLSAGPGSAALGVTVGGSPSVLSASSIQLTASIGASTTPAVSAGLPPGHLASENLDPSLQSFATLGNGAMCANVSAQSLAATAVPPGLVGCTVTTCSQCYTAANTLLDVIVGGCTVFVPQVQPTQPDAVDPAAPVAGNGPPYVLTANAQHQVTGCTAAGTQAPLADCLRAAAYSSAFALTTDRVIPRAPSPLLFADGFE